LNTASRSAEPGNRLMLAGETGDASEVFSGNGQLRPPSVL
jgi:hypothetical protein